MADSRRNKRSDYVLKTAECFARMRSFINATLKEMKDELLDAVRGSILKRYEDQVAVCGLDQDPEKEIIPRKPGRRNLGGFRRI
jgi:hypothetical protein